MGGGVGLLATPLLGGKLATFISVEGNLGLPNGSVSQTIAEMPFWLVKYAVFPVIKCVARLSPSRTPRKVGHWLGKANAWAFYRSAQSLRSYQNDTRLLQKFAALPSKAYCYGETSGRLQTVVPALLREHIETHEIPDAGHLMMIENPDAFYQTLANIIKNTR
jgi:pimeloyl-ACP methyl ester carboxylesterase